MHTQRSTRNLLIFGKTQPEHTEQLTLLNQENIGMAERDLVIMLKRKLSTKDKCDARSIYLDTYWERRRRKVKVHEPVDIETIFKLIDSMPMRQAEMTDKRN
jgi:hypothetical protein